MPSSAIELSPCLLTSDAGPHSAEAECGRFAVPENRADPHARTIDLRVAVARATARDAAPEALFVLAGGPGQAATDLYAAYAPAFARIRRTRDIVLVDQRGTGRSNALRCADEPADAGHGETTDPVALRLRAAECLAGLQADPRHYTTSVAVLDLDEVRNALGYARIDLYAASYGTRVAQHYYRRFPHHVRALVLDGVVPPEVVLGPDTALEAQRALDAILERCTSDERCNAAFPGIRESFTTLMQRLRQQSVALSVPDPASAIPVEFEFGLEQFGAAMRILSYSDETASLLPLLIDTAAVDGRLQPLAAQYLMIARRLGGQLAAGMHNAVVCTEDVPFIGSEAAALPAVTDAYLGSLQLDGLEAICAVWPQGELDADLHDPLTIDVPLLLLSGAADPITPPRYAERVLVQATDAVHVVQAAHGHGQLGSQCVNRLIARFLDEAAPRSLDLRCVDDAVPAPFFIDFTGTAP